MFVRNDQQIPKRRICNVYFIRINFYLKQVLKYNCMSVTYVSHEKSKCMITSFLTKNCPPRWALHFVLYSAQAHVPGK